jgi:hypothetical protein
MLFFGAPFGLADMSAWLVGRRGGQR